MEGSGNPIETNSQPAPTEYEARQSQLQEAFKSAEGIIKKHGKRTTVNAPKSALRKIVRIFDTVPHEFQSTLEKVLPGGTHINWESESDSTAKNTRITPKERKRPVDFDRIQFNDLPVKWNGKRHEANVAVSCRPGIEGFNFNLEPGGLESEGIPASAIISAINEQITAAVNHLEQSPAGKIRS